MATSRELINHYKEVNLGEVSLPLCFHHSEGNHLFDSDGKSYLDFTSGYGVTSTGWLRKEMVEVIQRQLEKSAYAPPWMPTEESIALSDLLLSVTPPNLVKVARASGGADANEVIYKAVIGSSGKCGIISFYRSYHGGTHFTLTLSDSHGFHLPKMPRGIPIQYAEPPYCYRCPSGQKPESCHLECTRHIENILEKNKNIGAFFLEPIIGSGGIIIPPPGYLQKIRRLCDRFGVFLVFDEVLTGFGRSGAITASALFDVVPDAISFAKGMSAGYAAMGAAVLNAELAEAVKKDQDVSTTFAWTPLACSVAEANIQIIIKERLPENAAILGDYLMKKVKALFKKYLPGNFGDIRGAGLMIGLELVMDSVTKIPARTLIQKFIISAFRKGLMVCASWDFQVLILMPPLNISKDEIEEGLRKIEETLQEISRSQPAPKIAQTF